MLHLQRDWDDRAKKFKAALSVDVIRGIIPFLGTTAGEGEWRFVIIDPADDMNRNAANALLKSLEEPPKRTLFFLITSASGPVVADNSLPVPDPALQPACESRSDADRRAICPWFQRA